MDLSNQKCVPCQGGVPPLAGEELQEYIKNLPSWELYEGSTKIRKEFEMANFRDAITLVNKIAKLAEEEAHHPDVYIHDFKYVRVELWTHKINGLHKNDIILASKIDKLFV